jgi:uncharacterized protein
MTVPVTAGAAARAPGVSVEWVSADVPVPAAVRTDVAGFIGLAPRGPAHQPVRLTSWSQFQAVFGGYDPRCWLAYAVNGYFANGADACWVVRVVDPATALPATALLTPGLVPGSGAGSGQPVLQATAISPGRWAQGARLTTADLGSGRFSLTVDLPGTREIWPELSLDDTDAQFYGTILNDPARGSQIVNLAGPAGASVGTGTVTLSGGADGLAGLQSGHFTGDLSTADGRPCGLGALDAVEEVGLVVVPDAVSRAAPAGAGEPPPRLTPDQTACLYNALLVSCASHRRFALLDEPSAQDLPADALAWALTLRQGTTAAAFGALGYPWLLVADPLAEPGAVLPVPGSGHLAGVFACTDLTVGVHKAPANATVVGALDVAWLVDVATHGRLTAASVNAITMRPGRGIRIMGARTLDQGTTWVYVNVRRLISMIELSLESSLAWLVFEPNTPSLQAAVEREIRAFLLSLWQRGALDGAQATDAMAVRCDDTTTTPDDVAVGRLICLISVQPPIPAAFVTVRIAITQSGVQVLGEQGGTGGQ